MSCVRRKGRAAHQFAGISLEGKERSKHPRASLWELNGENKTKNGKNILDRSIEEYGVAPRGLRTGPNSNILHCTCVLQLG